MYLLSIVYSELNELISILKLNQMSYAGNNPETLCVYYISNFYMHMNTPSGKTIVACCNQDITPLRRSTNTPYSASGLQDATASGVDNASV